jgi:hypothetical protein
MKLTTRFANACNAVEFSGRAVIPNEVWKALGIYLIKLTVGILLSIICQFTVLLFLSNKKKMQNVTTKSVNYFLYLSIEIASFLRRIYLTKYFCYFVTIEYFRLNIEYLRYSFDFKKGRSEATSTNLQSSIFNLQFRLCRVGP